MNKQMKIVLLVGIIILLFSACGQLATTPVPADGYIGLSYPPFPAGLSEGFGMSIEDSEDYSLSLVSDGDRKMLWLSKLTHHDSNGNAYWEVQDVLELSNLEAASP